MPHGFRQIHGIPRKTAYRLAQNQIYPAVLAVGDKSAKLASAGNFRSADEAVGINSRKIPAVSPEYKPAVILALRQKRLREPVRFERNARVNGDFFDVFPDFFNSFPYYNYPKLTKNQAILRFKQLKKGKIYKKIKKFQKNFKKTLKFWKNAPI